MKCQLIFEMLHNLLAYLWLYVLKYLHNVIKRKAITDFHIHLYMFRNLSILINL